MMRVHGAEVLAPPIRRVQTWASGYAASRPLIDASQGTSGAVPPAMPPLAIRFEEYGAREGRPSLRESIAADVNARHAGALLRSDDVMVTAGCNEAFCAAAGAILRAGDRALLLTPYYFNHDMWLRLIGVEPVYLELPADGTPDLDALESIAPGVSAIVAVSPANPTGTELSETAMARISGISRRHGVPLILDETYSFFRRDDTLAPHRLFEALDWRDHVVSLRSLSKEFSMPGQRVGAIIAGRELLAAASKWHDCMAIVAPAGGQAFAEYAFAELQGWRSDLAQSIRDNASALVSALQERESVFRVDSWGGFFVWLAYPSAGISDEDMARRLAEDVGILTVPGSYFSPQETGRLRVSIASLSKDRSQDLVDRLLEVEIG